MALWLPLVTLARLTSLVTLARLTSLVTLTVFACINMALIVIKGRDSHPENCMIVPIWVPWIGFFISCIMILLEIGTQVFLV